MLTDTKIIQTRNKIRKTNSGESVKIIFHVLNSQNNYQVDEDKTRRVNDLVTELKNKIIGCESEVKNTDIQSEAFKTDQWRSELDPNDFHVFLPCSPTAQTSLRVKLDGFNQGKLFVVYNSSLEMFGEQNVQFGLIETECCYDINKKVSTRRRVNAGNSNSTLFSQAKESPSVDNWKVAAQNLPIILNQKIGAYLQESVPSASP